MSISCLFFTAGECPSCQVLKVLDASLVVPEAQASLERRHCRSGAFIACPIFLRVERELAEANERLEELLPSSCTA